MEWQKNSYCNLNLLTKQLNKLLFYLNNKISSNVLKLDFIYFLICTLLGISAILLSNWSLYILPIIVLVILSSIYGERFIISIILITLFTLIAELIQSLRLVVHLIDFVLLGIIFLRRFGLNFELYARVPKSVIYFVLFYFSVMIISAAMSDYPFSSVPIITKQIIFLIIVYVFYSLIWDEQYIRLYFKNIIIVTCIVITVSAAEFLSEGYNVLSLLSLYRPRVTSITGNIEGATNFIIVAFPIAVTSILLKKDMYQKFLNYLFLFYLGFGIAIMMSRSAVLGIVVSTVIIFYILKRKLFYKFLISIVAILLLIFIFEPLRETATFFFRIPEGMGERDQIWEMSMEMIQDYPVFGIGPGAYGYFMYNYFPYMFDDWYGQLLIHFYEISGGQNLSHNFFLVLFTEMGILGLITALALPFIFIRIGMKTLRKYSDYSTATYYLIVALFASGISIIFRNIFNSIGLLYVSGIQTDLPFWLVFSGLIYFYLAPLSNNSLLQNKNQIVN